jgi:hypothetical protein
MSQIYHRSSIKCFSLQHPFADFVEVVFAQTLEILYRVQCGALFKAYLGTFSIK